MESSADEVSRIHSKYSLTLINPSSHYYSLVLSIVISTIIVATTVFWYLDYEEFFVRLAYVVAVLLATQVIDTQFIKRKEYSKSLHTSLFGNIIWLVTILAGILVSGILQKEENLFFVTQGMFLFASFRIGIFTTVLGASIWKGLAVCFIQPVAMYLALIPQERWTEIFEPTTLVFGLSFLGLAIIWSLLTDRAGRPAVKSSHKLVQAYIASQGDDHSEIEEMMEEKSKDNKIATHQIRFYSENEDFRVVLPEIHPGPFHPTGGSNIPYQIYKNFNSKAMILHSVSGHTLNLPSKKQVSHYLKTIEKYDTVESGSLCTEPVIVQINRTRSTGILFGKNVTLFLSLSPYGMEDIPMYIKTEIEQYAKNRNFEKVMIVDCHNAMGAEISKEDGNDLLKASKSCLDTLLIKEKYHFEFGYANSAEMTLNGDDLGQGGLGVLCLSVNRKRYYLGWADANNMQNGLRERIVAKFAEKGKNLLEICTSDTHYTPVKARNKNGYYQLGLVTNFEKIAGWYLEIAEKAEKHLKSASYEILKNESDVKVMGERIFEDYSKALDKSLKITKIFLIMGVSIFLVSLVL